MGIDFGSGVSRTLDPTDRQFEGVVWQKSKPPLDSEMNLMSQTAFEALRQSLKAVSPSGFFVDTTRASFDYLFNPLWTNKFNLGNPRTPVLSVEAPEEQPSIWACVNGWVLPIAGTNVAAEGDLSNVLQLNPPPASDARTDFVFLEVWATRVDSNPSTSNKPSASTLWKYGNVEYGGTNLTDDLEDPTIGYRTTGRIQIQYRLRVFGTGVGGGSSIALDVYPEGLNDPNVTAQGTSTSPVGGMTFLNMREALGDPGLWRAGDGDPNNDLGTVDGYVYAIPVCAVFRRNSGAYNAVQSAGNPIHNGGFNRTPGNSFLTDPSSGARVLTQATLTSFLAPTTGISADAVISITNLTGSGIDDPYHGVSASNPLYLVIDGEILGIKTVGVGTVTIASGSRGRYGTAAIGHQAGASISFFNTRPDGLYSDQIASTDVLDLRHAINPGDWDFARILEHNVGALLKGNLRSTWKKAANGDDSGVTTHEVSYLSADGAVAVPNYTEAVDGPDGIRTIWSDAATIQSGVTVLLDNEATQDANEKVGFTNPTFDNQAGFAWDVTAGFQPAGFMNVSGQTNTAVWMNGSVVLLSIGGASGNDGARSTFRAAGTRAVRAVMPKEWWRNSGALAADGNQYPLSLRFLQQRAHEPAPNYTDTTPTPADALSYHVGPMYPWWKTNFERPFIVLGGILNSTLKIDGVTTASLTNAGGRFFVNLAGFANFDTAGDFYSKDADGNFENDPTAVATPLLRAQRTLWGMITNDGADLSGNSSEVYIVIYGDKDSYQNNGAFKVVGAGTSASGYTEQYAPNATSLVVVPCGVDTTTFDSGTGNTVTVEFRSHEHNSDDISTWDTNFADVAVVLTDIGGLANGTTAVGGDHPWLNTALGFGTTYNLSMPVSTDVPARTAVPSKMLLDMSLMYHPGRGGTMRVPDEIVRFAMVGGSDDTIGAYLRQSKVDLDPDMAAQGAPADPPEVFWDPAHIQMWNRLPALGWNAPNAPSYGGEVVGFTEQDREHELFVDRGSKTIMFRPFRARNMTLQTMSYTLATLWANGTDNLFGSQAYPSAALKDGLVMFTAGKRMGIPVPYEFMPRFGRQDIPNYQDDTGAKPFLPGINHLFLDSADTSSLVFNIIGGVPTTSGNPGVKSMIFITGDDPAYPIGTPNYGADDTCPAAINNQPFIWARRTGDIDILNPYAQDIVDRLKAVRSSDLGSGLAGIQLPPYYGIARLYGVYDERDYGAAGGTSFKSNRYEMEAGAPPNLLREDVDQQSLFILQDGAKDLTTTDGDHTYIIPYNALDITRATNYVAGVTQPEDIHYVVECTVFGFAQGFIDKNNLVMVRRYDGRGLSAAGSGAGNVDGSYTLLNPTAPTHFELKGVGMVLPCPAGYNDQFYAAYNRTVYQGDPYMSRNGSKTTDDYEARYGQLSMGAQLAMRTPIQQYQSDGTFIPETPNARAFEVLASMDFYTTVGTGKIGGQLSPGTSLDVGYTENSHNASYRMSDDTNEPAWRVLTRAFTEGQRRNTNHASLGISLLNDNTNNPTSLNPVAGAIGTGSYGALRFTAQGGVTEDIYFSKAANVATLTGGGIAAENIVTIDETNETYELTPVQYSPGVAITLTMGADTGTSGGDKSVSVPGAAIDDAVIANLKYPAGTGGSSDADSMIVVGWVDSTDTVKLRFINTYRDNSLIALSSGGLRPSIVTVTPPAGPLTVVSQGTGSLTFTVTGADTAEDQIVTAHFKTATAGITDQLVLAAEVIAANTVKVWVHNPSTGPVNVIAADLIQISVLEGLSAAEIALRTANFVAPDYVNVRVIKTRYNPSINLNRTANNLATKINAHSVLSRDILAVPPGLYGTTVTVESVTPGAAGNGIRVAARMDSPTPYTYPIQSRIRLEVPRSGEFTRPPTGTNIASASVTAANLAGGTDLKVNAGNGTSQIRIGGMTERLPLGALLQDSDFLGENVLGDTASAVKSSPVGPRVISSVEPLTLEGDEYERFMGEPGSLIAQSEGSISTVSFTAYTDTTPGGTKRFRIYRGGGPLFVLDGTTPGGTVEWTSDSIFATLKPVLKGGILACRAMLVRNFPEQVVPGPYKVSDGDEIQMVIVTKGFLGSGSTQEDGIELGGSVSPAGYGEGWVASDRYRLEGKPLFKGYTREVPNPATVTLAPYPDIFRTY